MSPEIVELIKALARENGLTYTETEKIFYSQFKFVAHVIREDKDKTERRSVRLRKFGTFQFVPRIAEIMNEKHGKRQNAEKATKD